MKKLGRELQRAVSAMGGDSEEARINRRVQEVLERYRKAIESIYPAGTAMLHLAHTNKVIVKDVRSVGRDGGPIKVRTLIVYVDESIFAAELNAQRELIRLRLLELFGEDIEEFDIRISGKREYKREHPYVDESLEVPKPNVPPLPLTTEEKEFVNRTADLIEDRRVRKSLEKAMTADLEWKKNENVERERKNTK